MAAALHVHLLGVGVVELAVAELAVEAERLAVVGADLLDVVLPHGLHLGLGRAGLVALRLLVFVPLGRERRHVTTAHRTQTPRRHERDLRSAADRLFCCPGIKSFVGMCAAVAGLGLFYLDGGAARSRNVLRPGLPRIADVTSPDRKLRGRVWESAGEYKKGPDRGHTPYLYSIVMDRFKSELYIE